jgi:predicted negative regulator of RcsB-dependent stress response
LKIRSGLAEVDPQIAAIDLAGYLRSEGQLDQALAILTQAKQRLGDQSWLKLIMAEILHAKGDSVQALNLMNQTGEQSSSTH